MSSSSWINFLSISLDSRADPITHNPVELDVKDLEPCTKEQFAYAHGKLQGLQDVSPNAEQTADFNTSASEKDSVYKAVRVVFKNCAVDSAPIFRIDKSAAIGCRVRGDPEFFDQLEAGIQRSVLGLVPPIRLLITRNEHHILTGLCTDC